MGELLLIDSNTIEAPELEQFLADGPENLAILASEVWFELYKQRCVGALRRGLDIIGRYPNQVLGLRPGGETFRLDPVAPGLVDKMIDRRFSLAIGEIRDRRLAERHLRNRTRA